MRILVADDEPWIRKGLTAALRALVTDRPLDIVEAEDGMAAWERACESTPDLVLVDIHMPRLKGLDLVERLASLANLGPIVVITGHDEFEYAHRALQLRVFDFLLKPVPDDALRDVVLRAVAERDRQRHHEDWTGWTQRQLDGRRNDILARDLREWLEGAHTLDDLRRSASYLGLAWIERPALLLISWRSPDPAFLAASVRQRLAERAPAAWLVPWGDDRLLAVLPADEADSVAGDFVGDPEAGWTLETVSVSWEQVPDVVRNWGIEDSRSENLGLSSAARAYLERHFSEPDLSLESAAAHLRISPNHLSRLLKSAVGQSFAPYVLSLRIDLAKTLLGDPRLRVSEVAARVGFRDQNYFARQFRAQTGQSPLEWRSRKENP